MDKSASDGFDYSTTNPKLSKTWDMRSHWLRDRETINQLQMYRDKGFNNDANYFTKHHPTLRHRQMRHRYVHSKKLDLF